MIAVAGGGQPKPRASRPRPMTVNGPFRREGASIGTTEPPEKGAATLEARLDRERTIVRKNGCCQPSGARWHFVASRARWPAELARENRASDGGENRARPTVVLREMRTRTREAQGKAASGRMRRSFFSFNYRVLKLVVRLLQGGGARAVGSAVALDAVAVGRHSQREHTNARGADLIVRTNHRPFGPHHQLAHCRWQSPADRVASQLELFELLLSEGTVPVSALSARRRYRSETRLASAVGSGPDKRFCSRISVVKEVMDPSSAGIVPLNRLERMSALFSTFNLPSSVGIGPEMPVFDT
jgi:hypothetical protein